jgi:hypothetical protein
MVGAMADEQSGYGERLVKLVSLMPILSGTDALRLVLLGEIRREGIVYSADALAAMTLVDRALVERNSHPY